MSNVLSCSKVKSSSSGTLPFHDDVEIVILGVIENLGLIGYSTQDINIRFDKLLAHITKDGINTVLQKLENLPSGAGNSGVCYHEWVTYTGLGTQASYDYCKKCDQIKKEKK